MKDFITLAKPNRSVALSPEAAISGSTAMSTSERADDAHPFLLSLAAADEFIKQMRQRRRDSGMNWWREAYELTTKLIPKLDAYALSEEGIRADLLSGRSIDRTQYIYSALLADGDNVGADAFLTNLRPKLINPTPELTPFLRDPITIATVYAITAGGLFNRELVPAMVLHYVTLAKGESDLNSGAVSRSSSARGQLQIINSTYSASCSQFRRAVADSFTAVPLNVAKLFANRRVSGGYVPFNRSNPALDATQYQANVGVLLNHLNCVDRYWTFDPASGWTSLRRGDGALYLIRNYPDILRNYDVGRQLLFTFYHINGGRADNLVKLSHVGRLRQDTRYFATLDATPGLTDFIAKSSVILVDGSLSNEPLSPGSSVSDINAVTIRSFNVKSDGVPRGVDVITSRFGNRAKAAAKDAWISRNHKGLDLRAAVGTAVFAVDDGIIDSLYFKEGRGWGRSVVLKSTTDGSLFRYAHLNRIFVEKGAIVKKGQIIAESGMTGTRAPHLHLEFSLPGKSQSDPLNDPLKRWRDAL